MGGGIAGVEELDSHDRWERIPQYGWAWKPHAVVAGWVPEGPAVRTVRYAPARVVFVGGGYIRETHVHDAHARQTGLVTSRMRETGRCPGSLSGSREPVSTLQILAMIVFATGRMPMKESISFRLNGKPVQLEIDGDRTLLWVLRTDLGLTGTKYGCGESLCGACTVVVGKEAVRSCQLPMKAVRGKEVTTIEGLEKNGKLHPLQEAFADVGGLQCGYCTPGMIMNAYALLLKTPRPSRRQILAGMEDNLCRCAAHNRIVKAIERASTVA